MIVTRYFRYKNVYSPLSKQYLNICATTTTAGTVVIAKVLNIPSINYTVLHVCKCVCEES